MKDYESMTDRFIIEIDPFCTTEHKMDLRMRVALLALRRGDNVEIRYHHEWDIHLERERRALDGHEGA